jgi:hypothetical protein
VKKTSVIVATLAVFGALPIAATAQANTNVQQTAVHRDGQADFDSEIGSWKTHLRRLLEPLTGSTTWARFSFAF